MYLTVPTPIRPKRRQKIGTTTQVEQQVPISVQPAAVETANIVNMRAYEKEIEQDFQAQIKPILQMYLQKTRRPSPINSVFDMSSCENV
jgi:hypothetical protein